jgi:hypothetical protein
MIDGTVIIWPGWEVANYKSFEFVFVMCMLWCSLEMLC